MTVAAPPSAPGIAPVPPGGGLRLPPPRRACAAALPLGHAHRARRRPRRAAGDGGGAGLGGLERGGGPAAALRTIGRETAPDVAAANDISFSLADMDANLANHLLVGERTDLGLTRAETDEFYAERRATVTGQLATAAANARDDAERTAVAELLDRLGAFEAHAATAPVLADGGDAAGALAALPAGHRPDARRAPARRRALSTANVDGLERAYDDARSSASRRQALVVGLGVVLLALLVAIQVFLHRRTRRLLNPALLLATLVAAGLVGSLVVVLRGGAEDLRAANRDAFASVLALSSARSVAYDANADESRYLIDPERAADYEEAFLSRTSQLVDIPGARLDTFDDEFAAALDRVRASEADEDVTFDGYFGTALRNITFPGERDAALDDARRVRDVPGRRPPDPRPRAQRRPRRGGAVPPVVRRGRLELGLRPLRRVAHRLPRPQPGLVRAVRRPRRGPARRLGAPCARGGRGRGGARGRGPATPHRRSTRPEAARHGTEGTPHTRPQPCTLRLAFAEARAPRRGPGMLGCSVDVIVLIGRVLFVAIFLGSGVAHLTQTRDMADFTSSKGSRTQGCSCSCRVSRCWLAA